jgi:hypothetical protein
MFANTSFDQQAIAGDSVLATLVAMDWMQGGTPYLDLVAEVKCGLVLVDERVSRGSVKVDVSDFSSGLSAMVRTHAYCSWRHMQILEELEIVTPDFAQLALVYTAIERQKLALDLSGW